MTPQKQHNTNQAREKSSNVDHVVSVNRVTKVTKGGKRFSFSAFIVSGDGHGKIGYGLGKSKEVSSAIAKATSSARKRMIDVALRGSTIPYPVVGYHGACKVVLLPASKGTGNIAGGAVRAIMNAIGISDILTKAFGSGNSQNVAKATLNALSKLRSAKHLAKLRGTTIEKMVKGV